MKQGKFELKILMSNLLDRMKEMIDHSDARETLKQQLFQLKASIELS